MTTEDDRPVLYYRDSRGRLRVADPKLVSPETLARKVVTRTRTKVVKVEVREPGPIELAVTAMPKVVQVIVKEIMEDPQLNEGVRAMTERWQEFSSVTAAIMSGIYAHPPSREMWDTRLDLHWDKTAVPREAGEVIVGAGVHAAIYAAMRVRMGFAPPTVVEGRGRVGGVFAISRKPSFNLNSRNRPGPHGLPGDPGTALNALPGCWVQVSDVIASEFVSNTTMAWVVRANLALSGARVVTNTFVADRVTYEPPVYYGSRRRETPQLRVAIGGSSRTKIRRLLWATGLSKQRKLSKLFDGTGLYLTFLEFMQMMDQPFPLKGMRKVAVIGAGDSGKTAIEALTGRGPEPGMSVPAIDNIEQIMWFGVEQSCFTKQRWLANARSRYKSIGALLPDDNINVEDRFQVAKVLPRGKLEEAFLSRGMDGLRIGLKTFDYVIDCTGIETAPPQVPEILRDLGSNGRRLARENKSLQYVIGPAAAFDLSDSEKTRYGAIGDNAVAIFRYADRTAQLAKILPDV